jgi:dephospho-CoA kinase
MADSENVKDNKDAIVDGVFKFIDRMNDVCELDTADRIVHEFIQHMNPLIQEYLELRYGSDYQRQQLWLEFRSLEEIAEQDQKRRARLRSAEISFDDLVKDIKGSK